MLAVHHALLEQLLQPLQAAAGQEKNHTINVQKTKRAWDTSKEYRAPSTPAAEC
jgi:hypothetical protein